MSEFKDSGRPSELATEFSFQNQVDFHISSQLDALTQVEAPDWMLELVDSEENRAYLQNLHNRWQMELGEDKNAVKKADLANVRDLL